MFTTIYAPGSALCVRIAEWITDEWLAKLQETIEAGQPTTVQLHRFQSKLPTLEAFQYFRSKAQFLPPVAWALFEALRQDAGIALESLPPAQLDQEIRRTINRETRLAWKSGLESKCPQLLLSQRELAGLI